MGIANGQEKSKEDFLRLQSSTKHVLKEEPFFQYNKTRIVKVKRTLNVQSKVYLTAALQILDHLMKYIRRKKSIEATVAHYNKNKIGLVDVFYIYLFIS